LERSSERLANGLEQVAANSGVKAVVNRVGSMLGLFFTDQPVKNFNDAKTSNLDKFAAYYRKMLERGIYLAPSQFESLFVSAAHSDQDIDDTIIAAKEVLAEL
ncbi:MAG: aspartate aminotransferase family protein, partial [Desulfobacteraceae bacterium]|nr:aspartate aminotransferase family protein [Desulfobacteraceae bacterium]